MPERAPDDEIVDVEEVAGDLQPDTFSSPAEAEIYALLAADHTDFDSLCRLSNLPAKEVSSALVMLEIAGVAKNAGPNKYVKTVQASGNARNSGTAVAVTSSITTEIANLIAKFKDSIRFHRQGISRKYLQLALANFWCHVDRIRWNHGALLSACLQSKPIHDVEVPLYITPPAVWILPLKASKREAIGSDNSENSLQATHPVDHCCQRAASYG